MIDYEAITLAIARDVRVMQQNVVRRIQEQQQGLDFADCHHVCCRIEKQCCGCCWVKGPK